MNNQETGDPKPKDFFSTVHYLDRDEIYVNGNMYSKSTIKAKEIFVTGDCFIEGRIIADKMVVMGKLFANKIQVQELFVYGYADIKLLRGYDLHFANDLCVIKAELKQSDVVVYGNIKANCIVANDNTNIYCGGNST